MLIPFIQVIHISSFHTFKTNRVPEDPGNLEIF